MATQIFTHFYLKKSVIHLRLTLNGERCEISTHKKIDTSAWDKVNQKVYGRSDYARAINTTLNNLLSSVERLCINHEVKGEKVILRLIVDELKGNGPNQMTLFKAYESHIADIRKLIGTDFTATTIKRYTSSFNNLKRYLKDRDVKLSDLNYKFISDFYTYLKTTEKLQQNSTTNVIKNLVRVINVAITNNWLTSNPFRGFNCNYVNPPRAYLTETEIETLINKDFAIERLAKVRDVFIQVYG